MKELIEKTQRVLSEHLRLLVVDVENHGGFKSSAQLDDVKDCLVGLKCCRYVESMEKNEKRIV